MTVGFVYRENGVDMKPDLDRFVNTHTTQRSRGLYSR